MINKIVATIKDKAMHKKNDFQKKSVTVRFRVSKKQRLQLQLRADEKYGGNISKYIMNELFFKK